MDNTIVYKICNASHMDLYDHLTGCDNNYFPPLSNRVSIYEYAMKIHDRSVTFEAWSDTMLVGLVAAYFNDPQNMLGYITNVSVLKGFMGFGVASRLIEKCLYYAKKHGFDEIILEVNVTNISAIHLYRKFAFECIKIVDDSMFMKIENLKTRVTEHLIAVD